MEKIAVLSIFFGVLIFILFRGKVEEKKREEKIQKKLKENFGKANERAWKEQEIERISHYCKDKVTEDFIDDITWNDLDMDLIYQQIAYTQSSLGDDFLYYMLRNPVKDEEILSDREKKICSLSQQPEFRRKIQVLCARIGKIRDYSFSDYISCLMEEQPRSNRKHYLMDILIVLSVCLMIYNTGIGMVVFFFLILYNILMYFKDKAYLEPYLLSLRYLFKIMDYGKEITDCLPKAWEKEQEESKKILASMNKIRRNSYLVMSPGRLGGEGLELILDYLRMCLHLDIIKFNNMLLQLQNYEHEIWKLYEIIGGVDACAAIVCYRAYLKESCIPKFRKVPGIIMEQGYHPMIEHPVANSLDMKKNILLTGSNASGKSTFLKTMGINILLAQTIHTCCAKSFQMPICRLYTSMSLKDSIALKESYYMAEIKAMKRILDGAEGDSMVVCMVDEVLRGTNTVERIAASTQILKSMAKKNVLCMAATHDGELTKTLEQEYDNYHFEESVEQTDVKFSYILKRGRAESCNAITLLEHLGYHEQLVDQARKMVTHFKEKGEWICV